MTKIVQKKVSQQTQPKKSQKAVDKLPVSLSSKQEQRSNPSKKSVNPTGFGQQRFSNPPKSKVILNEKGNIIDDILSTGQSVAKTVSSLGSGNPLGLLEVPNSIMKVIDTTKNIIRNVSTTDQKEKVILSNQSEIKSQGDQVLLNKLKTTMPVITTTQLPTSYSTEYSQPPLEITEYSAGNRKIQRVRGTYALATCVDDNNSLSTRWNYSFRLTPTSPGVFGSRVNAIADKFQMWRIKSVTASWIPTQGTDYVGNYYLVFMDGTDIANHYAASITFQDISQREHAQPGSVKQGSNLTYKPVDNNWFYCSNWASSDMKFYSPASFGTLVYNYVPTVTANRVGYVLLTFDLEFTSASEAAWSFQSTMKRMFHSVWLSSCKLNLAHDVWLSAAWSLISELAQGLKKLNLLQDKDLRSLSGCCNQEFLDVRQKLNKVKDTLEDRPDYEKLIKVNPIGRSSSLFLEELIRENASIRTIMKKQELDDPLLVFGTDSFQQLLVLMIMYFRGSIILENSYDFFLKVLRDSLKSSWKEYHPYQLKLPDPETSDDDILSTNSDSELEIIELSD